MTPQDEIDFYAWWAEHGRFIDPDTSDVDWFDKRKELCALAFMAARRPVTSQMMGAAIQNAKARHLTRVDGRNNELQAALSPSGEAPDCVPSAAHDEKWDRDNRHSGEAPTKQNRVCKESLPTAPAEPEREWCLAWEWDTDPQGGTRRVIAKSEADADNCICNVDSRTLRKQWRTKAGDWQDAALLPAERAGKETK